MTIFWIDNTGTILNASSDDVPSPSRAVNGIHVGSGPSPTGTISGPPPESGKQRWLGAVWSVPPPPPPDPVIALDAAISSAATLAALKVVLKGKVAAR